MTVQRSDELRSAFGLPSGGHCPQVLISTVFDVLAFCPHDFTVAPCAAGERAELIAMLDSVPKGSVLVLDRGYPSFELMREIVDRGLHFVMRAKSDMSVAVRDFVTYRGTDEIIEIQPPQDIKKRYPQPLDARALYFSKDGSDPTILLTDLVGPRYPAAAIGGLYGGRWQVEEYYKVENDSVFTIGQCRSKSANGVKQEVGAFALFVALSRHLAVAAAKRAETPVAAISRRHCMLRLSRCLLIAGFMDNQNVAARAIHRIVVLLARRKSRDRPDRSYPRISFKPRKRWNSKGKRGSNLLRNPGRPRSSRRRDSGA